MTEVRVRRSVGYAVVQDTQPPSELLVRKGVGYAVVQDTQPPSEMLVRKAVGYAVIQDTTYFTETQIQKAVGYAVIQTDPSGKAYQTASALRPVYRTGAVPYVSFAAPGSALEITPLLPGLYTLLALRPDGTIEESTVTLAAGSNTLPTEDFNQLVILFGIPDRRLVRRVKLTMLGRAGL